MTVTPISRPDAHRFTARIVSWAGHRDALTRLRHLVFVTELNVPPELELDAYDPDSVHAAAMDAQSRMIATGRLTPEGKIGRMAVLQPWRGRGVGQAVLACLTRQAEDLGLARVSLAAQIRAQEFYAKFGFVPVGDVFIEAGIEHILMHRCLSA